MNWTLINTFLFLMIVLSVIILNGNETPDYATSSPRPNHRLAQVEGESIPRSRRGDKGRYYLLSAKQKGIYIRTVHKRVGTHAVGFSETLIECMPPRRYKDLGYGEGTVSDIKKHNKPKWVDIIINGSSKSDLVRHVCKRFVMPSNKPY